MKRDEDYLREGYHIMEDEIEDILLKKYKEQKLEDAGAAEEPAKQLKQQAVVDDLLHSKRYLYSLAEMKRIWKGENGRFQRRDLLAWFRIFNQTRINKSRGFLTRLQNLFDRKAAANESLTDTDSANEAEEENQKDELSKSGPGPKAHTLDEYLRA